MRLLKEPIACDTYVKITGGFFRGKEGFVCAMRCFYLFGFGYTRYDVKKEGSIYTDISEEDITPTL